LASSRCEISAAPALGAAEMKVLIVAFWFPPSNLVGAIRVGKLARYLDHRGHEPRVLTTDISEDRSLPLEIPREHVVYTDYPKRRDWFDLLARPFRRRPAAPTGENGGVAHAPDAVPSNSPWGMLRRQYYGLVHIPDQRIDWVKTAIPAGERLIEEWRPDIIFASAPPFTGLIVASRLGRAFDVPWVADFRDLWADNPYYSFPAWRRSIDRIVERVTLRNASALVTISPQLARHLKTLHHKRVEVVFNGYAEEDFPEMSVENRMTGPLTIRYIGSIYRGFRDPSPLFVAIGLLESRLRRQIRVEFFGESDTGVEALAAKHGVADRIEMRARVPYRSALELQLQADVLLLLQWNDKRDEGTIPAKLFEYLYARRPILYIGYAHGIAAQLIRERAAGFISNSPECICDQLQTWVEQKRSGCLKRLDPSVSRGLSRDEQFRNLEQLFAEILDQKPIAKKL
jgi:glycosyltransferase involved in cell wall biosynthesis